MAAMDNGGMPSPVLDDETISAALATLTWTREGDELVLVVRRRNFVEAMAFVNQVAEKAEQAGHHPDIAISWNEVTLRLTTHDAGGITDADLQLARQLEELAGITGM
jgi:4a-hydroxytetrahydrobiopterin dehydratase